MVLSAVRNSFLTCIPHLPGRYYGATTGPADAEGYSDGERRPPRTARPRIPRPAYPWFLDRWPRVSREAWVRCGKPKGEAGIQRIRKAGFKLRKPQPVLPPRAPAKPSEPTGPGKGMPAKGYRLTSTQLKKEQVAQQKAKQEWDAVYAVATVEWQRRVAAGMTGRGQQSAADFAASVEVPAALGASRSRSTCSSVRCASSFL